METWTNWEIRRVYKRVSDGRVYQAYDSSVLHGIALAPVPVIGRVLYCDQLSPAGFLLCEGEEKITKVRNKETGVEAEVYPNDEFFIGGVTAQAIYSNYDRACSDVVYFRDLVQGKHADKFEFTTEYVITKEIPHESTVKPKCEKCGKELECPGWKKYADLKLCIIPGSPEMCEKVQNRLSEMGYGWIVNGKPIKIIGSATVNVGFYHSTSISYCEELTPALNWRSINFPESELLTGQEFLDKYGAGE